jgi:hypothetical protein
MKPLFILGVIVAIGAGWPSRALAQMQIQQIDDPPRVAVFFETGGNAILSGSVDVLVAPHTSVRAGGFMWPFPDIPAGPWNGLVMVNQLFGGHGHYVEAGVGLVAIHGFDETWGIAVGPTATIGYRIQTRRRFARIGLTPSAPRSDGRRRRPAVGFSIGRTF